MGRKYSRTGLKAKLYSFSGTYRRIPFDVTRKQFRAMKRQARKNRVREIKLRTLKESYGTKAE